MPTAQNSTDQKPPEPPWPARGLDEDSWIAAHSPIDPKKLHALGFINLSWNGVEYWLHALLATVSRTSEATSWKFVYDLRDTAICERIKAFAADRDFDEPTAQAIKQALEAFDICRHNRNHLVHYSLGEREGRRGLTLYRVAQKPIRKPEPLPDELDDIRRVADEIEGVRVFLRELAMATWHSPHAAPLPSLDTLPRPKLLWSPVPPPQKRRQRRAVDIDVRPERLP